MPLCKRRTYSGVVLEQEVFWVGANAKNLRNIEPKPPGRSEAEKALYNERQSMKRFIRNLNSNFTPDDYYVTLTLDNDHLVDMFPEAKTIRESYIRSLRRLFPDVVLVMVMGRGKRTKRIHYHMLISGVPRRVISEKWVWGRIKNIEHLREHNYYNRIDHGADYTGLAIYLFDHWTPEQGKGKRWRQTINLRQPAKEKPTIPKRIYSTSRPPITPKGYQLVEARSTEYGYLYFKYVKIVGKPTAKRKC